MKGTWNNIVEIIDGEIYYFKKKTGQHSVAKYMLETFIEKNGYKPFLLINSIEPTDILKEASEMIFSSYDIKKNNGKQELNSRDKQRLKRIIFKSLESELVKLKII